MKKRIKLSITPIVEFDTLENDVLNLVLGGGNGDPICNCYSGGTLTTCECYAGGTKNTPCSTDATPVCSTDATCTVVGPSFCPTLTLCIQYPNS